jgi:excisionase family DNA binding protein
MKLTPKQAAARAGVSVSLIYELCSQGRIPHYRLGGRGKRGTIRVEDTDLDAFLAECRCETSADADTIRLNHIKLDARHG